MHALGDGGKKNTPETSGRTRLINASIFNYKAQQLILLQHEIIQGMSNTSLQNLSHQTPRARPVSTISDSNLFCPGFCQSSGERKPCVICTTSSWKTTIAALVCLFLINNDSKRPKPNFTKHWGTQRIPKKLSAVLHVPLCSASASQVSIRNWNTQAAVSLAIYFAHFWNVNIPLVLQVCAWSSHRAFKSRWPEWSESSMCTQTVLLFEEQHQCWGF